MNPLLVFVLVLVAGAIGFVLGTQYQEFVVAREEESENG